MERQEAAEDVCWALLLVMGFDGLEDVPMAWRPVLAEPLEKWLATEAPTGVV